MGQSALFAMLDLTQVDPDWSCVINASRDSSLFWAQLLVLIAPSGNSPIYLAVRNVTSVKLGRLVRVLGQWVVRHVLVGPMVGVGVYLSAGHVLQDRSLRNKVKHRARVAVPGRCRPKAVFPLVRVALLGIICLYRARVLACHAQQDPLPLPEPLPVSPVARALTLIIGHQRNARIVAEESFHLLQGLQNAPLVQKNLHRMSDRQLVHV